MYNTAYVMPTATRTLRANDPRSNIAGDPVPDSSDDVAVVVAHVPVKVMVGTRSVTVTAEESGELLLASVGSGEDGIVLHTSISIKVMGGYAEWVESCLRSWARGCCHDSSSDEPFR